MQFVHRLSVIFIISFAVQDYCVNARKRLPNYVKTCRRKDPNLVKCLMEETLESVRPHLAEGIRNMGIPPLEPLVIPELKSNGNGGPLKFKLIANDIKVWGIPDFKLKNVKLSYEKSQVEGTIILPSIYVTCKYDIDGKYSDLQLKGKGDFKGNITNIKADISVTGKRATDTNDHPIIQMETVDVKVKIADATGTAKNTDGKYSDITKIAIDFYNENRRGVLDTVTPTVEEVSEDFIKKLGNTILNSVLLDEILPDN